MKGPGIMALSLAAAASWCAIVPASAEPPAVGDAAPPLSISTYVQGPDDADASWDALRGKVVIVEFWTTWCGPCIAAIPHLNELAETFEDKPVQFIAISNETSDKVEALLERRPMKAWVVLDDENQTWEDYGIEGIPHTILVDAKGTIAAITHPNSLRAEHIEQVLAGEKPEGLDVARGMTVAAMAGVDPDDEGAEPPLFQVLIRKSDALGGAASMGPHAMTMRGFSADALIRSAYRASNARIEILADLGDDRYTLVARVPAAQASELRPLVKKAIETTFGVSSAHEMRRVPSLVLVLPDDGAHKLEPVGDAVGTSMSSGMDRISLIGLPLWSFAGRLENIFGIPVIDETGLDGRFDIELRFDPDIFQLDRGERISKFADLIKKELGLELREAEREIEILVIRPRGDDA